MDRVPGQLKVLLLGYNGANNTGAEALLSADIEDVLSVLGQKVLMTVPTLNEKNLRRYLTESENLRIVAIPPVFFFTLHRLAAQNDLVMLVEGSCYMDTWTSALLWAFLWATRCARKLGKPCIAYAVDAGVIRSSFNRWLVRKEAGKTDLIITRSASARERLRSWGVDAPMAVTADNAFNFQPSREDEDILDRMWPERGGEVAGLALVDFNLWPVVIRPWGPRSACYRWPYYFSRSPERSRRSGILAGELAAAADYLIQERGLPVALIAMEELDEPFAHRVRECMRQPDHARVFSSRYLNASQMTMLLRKLKILVTSRYHACILSLAAGVPQIAVGHDLRLKTIYQELGLGDHFFLDPCHPGLSGLLRERLQEILDNSGSIREQLASGYTEHLQSSRRNRQLLREFLQDRGFEVTG